MKCPLDYGSDCKKEDFLHLTGVETNLRFRLVINLDRFADVFLVNRIGLEKA